MAADPFRGLLLDTHVWIRMMAGDADRLAADWIAMIMEAANAGRIHISAISAWEVAMLESKGRLRLNTDCLSWIRSALAAPGTRLLPLSPEIAVASASLPGEFHGDPADRIIVATARLLDLVLVTRDERIRDYSAQGYVAVPAG